MQKPDLPCFGTWLREENKVTDIRTLNWNQMNMYREAYRRFLFAKRVASLLEEHFPNLPIFTSWDDLAYGIVDVTRFGVLLPHQITIEAVLGVHYKCIHNNKKAMFFTAAGISYETWIDSKKMSPYWRTIKFYPLGEQK
ncbi:MAG: hypothetical protein ACRCUJ_02975 [Phocaeicola sp.]